MRIIVVVSKGECKVEVDGRSYNIVVVDLFAIIVPNRTMR